MSEEREVLIAVKVPEGNEFGYVAAYNERGENLDVRRIINPAPAAQIPAPDVEPWCRLNVPQPAERDGAGPDELHGIFVALFDELEHRKSRSRTDDAPGHSHETPGIWDSDNGQLAGKPCAWCALWRKGKELRERLAASHGGDGNV